MKLKLTLLAAVAALGLLALPVRAQTTTAPTNIQDIATQAFTWATAFNTNITTFRGGSSVSLWTAAISEQRGAAPLINEVGLSYDVFNTSAFNPATGRSTALFLEARERNTGLAGTISSFQGGVGFGLTVWDLRLELAVDIGDNLIRAVGQDRLYGEVNFKIMKALGDHYFAHVGAFEDFPYAVPGLYAGVGARF